MHTEELQGEEITYRSSKNYTAKKGINLTVQTWFVTALIGQLIFAYYILVLYGGATLSRNLQAWNTFMPHGYTEGHGLSNTAVFIHVFLAAVITIGGPLQIIPQIRNLFPRFHRWNGRLYVLTAIVISFTGAMINILNEPIGSRLNANLTAFNGVLIIIFTFFAWKRAIQKQFTSHRKWALRLFMAASGVWFYRIGLMFWIIINGGPRGFDPETFSGPALTILNAAQFVLPLLMLECYFFAEKQKNLLIKWLFSSVMVILILATAVGIFAAAMGLWFPYV